MDKKKLYLVTGSFLILFLVGLVLILRSVGPRAPSANIESPRARGPKDAPVQIIEFSDFQCPACKTAQGKLAELFRQYPGLIRLVFFHFPLEGHKWSPLAHRAAECAALQNRFWLYHDLLYKEQDTWSKNPDPPLVALLTYAKTSQVPNLNEFARCLADSKVDKLIMQEKETGLSLGVRSTPSFFVNGDLVVGIDLLQTKVDEIRTRKRK